MAIYHFHCGIISRAKGLSAVAGSAYMSCEKIKCEYDNQEHDYSKKKNHVYGNVLLPKNAPEEYRDKKVLWNSVEMFEKSSNAQLSRNGDVALPKELSLDEQIELCEEFFSKFADQGMCVQYDIHTPDEDSQNVHAHFMLSMRGIDEKGNWLPKSCKEYKCQKGEEEPRFFRPEEIPEGWEKVVNKKGNFVTRNNDINGWGSKETLLEWRKTWADMCNEKLREKGVEEISHLSNEERGLDSVPQVHLGSYNSKLMKEGKTNERIEKYYEIEQVNKEINEVNHELQVMLEEVLQERAEEPLEQVLTQSEYNLIVIIINALKNALETILGLNKQIRELTDEVEERENKFKMKVIQFAKDRDELENFKNYANDKIYDLRTKRTEIITDLNGQYGLNIEKTKDIQPIINDYEEYLSIHKVISDPLPAEQNETGTLIPELEVELTEKTKVMDREEVLKVPNSLGIKAKDWGDKDLRKKKSLDGPIIKTNTKDNAAQILSQKKNKPSAPTGGGTDR